MGSRGFHHIPHSMKLLLWVRTGRPALKKLLESEEFLIRPGLKTLGVVDEKAWMLIRFESVLNVVPPHRSVRLVGLMYRSA